MTFLPQRYRSWIGLLVSQLAAFMLAFACISIAGGAIVWSNPVVLILQGLAAAGIGRLIGMPRIWWLQALLPLGVVYNALVPAWTYFGAFVLCALVYWNSASEQVPLYLTNRKTWQALSDLAARQNAGSFVDLGCGMGGVVIFLARARPELNAAGVETAPLVFLAAWVRALFAGLPNARIIYRNIWDEDLSRYDIVYCFLSPVPMPRVYEKARGQMRTGSILVSNSFAVIGHTANEIIEVDDERRTRLHLYRM